MSNDSNQETEKTAHRATIFAAIIGSLIAGFFAIYVAYLDPKEPSTQTNYGDTATVNGGGTVIQGDNITNIYESSEKEQNKYYLKKWKMPYQTPTKKGKDEPLSHGEPQICEEFQEGWEYLKLYRGATKFPRLDSGYTGDVDIFLPKLPSYRDRKTWPKVYLSKNDSPSNEELSENLTYGYIYTVSGVFYLFFNKPEAYDNAAICFRKTKDSSEADITGSHKDISSLTNITGVNNTSTNVHINELNLINKIEPAEVTSKCKPVSFNAWEGGFIGKAVGKSPNNDPGVNEKKDWCGTTLTCDGETIEVPHCIQNLHNMQGPPHASWTINESIGLFKGCAYTMFFLVADGSSPLKEEPRNLAIEVNYSSEGNPVHLDGRLITTQTNGTPECGWSDYNEVLVHDINEINYSGGAMSIEASLTNGATSFPHIQRILLKPKN